MHELYELLMKWQAVFLSLFLLMMLALIVVLLVSASLGRPKPPDEGDKVDDEQDT